jgi:hypothetical protein
MYINADPYTNEWHLMSSVRAAAVSPDGQTNYNSCAIHKSGSGSCDTNTLILGRETAWGMSISTHRIVPVLGEAWIASFFNGLGTGYSYFFTFVPVSRLPEPVSYQDVQAELNP